jgi:hypothetical protein
LSSPAKCKTNEWLDEHAVHSTAAIGRHIHTVDAGKLVGLLLDLIQSAQHTHRNALPLIPSSLRFFFFMKKTVRIRHLIKNLTKCPVLSCRFRRHMCHPSSVENTLYHDRSDLRAMSASSSPRLSKLTPESAESGRWRRKDEEMYWQGACPVSQRASQPPSPSCRWLAQPSATHQGKTKHPRNNRENKEVYSFIRLIPNRVPRQQSKDGPPQRSR